MSAFALLCHSNANVDSKRVGISSAAKRGEGGGYGKYMPGISNKMLKLIEKLRRGRGRKLF